MLAVTLSSCDGNDKEVTQLREKNRQLGDGINQILKTQSEKKSALEKSLEGIHIQLGKVGAEKEKLDGDLNKVESEAAKTLIRQSLGKTTTQKEKLEKEKACLKEKIQSIKDLPKDLHALYAEPKKTDSPVPTSKP